MVVTLAAGHGGAEPVCCGRTHALGLVFLEVLLVLDTAFPADLVQAVVAGGNELFDRGIRQQVAGDLLDGKLVVGFVFIEGLNHVVAVGRRVALLVAVVPYGVGVANRIEPVNGHLFPVVPGAQKSVDESFVCSGTLVLEKGRDFFGRGRQSDQIQGNTSDESGFRCLRRGLQIPVAQLLFYDLVDAGLRRSFDRGVCPVALVDRAFSDPAFEQEFFLIRQLLVGLGSGHHFLGIVAEYPVKQLAVFRIARNEGECLDRLFSNIESQVGFTLLFVGPVAVVTVVGQDRPDMPVEVNLIDLVDGGLSRFHGIG